MGKGGKLLSQERGEEKLTWEAVRKHTAREDQWIVIDNQVYDITNWARKHPGGSKVISHYAGQDASEAFKAFHPNPDFPRKFMKAIHLGPLTADEVKEEEITKDMEELRETATKMGLFKPSIFFFVTNFLHLLAMEVGAYLILSYFGTGWLPFLASLLLLGTMQAQAGWTQHDYGHLSVFNNRWLTWFFHQYTMGFIKGASPDWWNHMHFQHHAKPNVVNKDPDVRLEDLFVLGEVSAKRVAKKKTYNSFNLPYNWQHKYWFAIGPPMIIPVYFQLMVFRHTIKRGKWTDLIVLTAMYVKNFALYVPLLGFFWTLALLVGMRQIESHWFVWVSQSNHIPMEIDEDKERPWLSLQLHATCDIEKSQFNDWFTGHLNFQIEHHLFPTMPRHNLYKIQPLVKSLCEKHGIPHQTKGLWEAFVDIYKTLQTSGQMWDHFFHAYHMHQ